MDDSTATGWLAWPKSYKAYLPRTETFVMPEVDADSRPAFDHLEQFFGQESFWEKHIEYVAQEPVRGERHDSFSTEQTRLYKSIFGLWEDKFLDVIVPPLTKLCAKVDDKNSQRTAAELMGGLIRGSKHWKKSGLDRMWAVLTPLLKKAFQQCTPDSLLYWERFVKYCCHSRDPRRVLPLISLIFNTPLDKDSTAAFSESKNLFFTRAALISFSWRVSLLTPALREDCLRHVTHPYKQVREILGHVINELFQLAPHPSYKSVDAFLKDQKALGDASSPMVEQIDEKSAHQIAELVKKLEKWRTERPPAVQGASDYTNASKTGTLYPCFSHSSLRVGCVFLNQETKYVVYSINVIGILLPSFNSACMGVPSADWVPSSVDIWGDLASDTRNLSNAGYSGRPGFATAGDTFPIATRTICVPSRDGSHIGGHVLQDPEGIDQLACPKQCPSGCTDLLL